MKKNSKNFVFSLIILAILFCLFVNRQNYVLADNTIVNEIDITSAEDLFKIGNDVNFPVQNVKYTLKQDLNLEDESFEPIKEFSGVFDGNGYKIKGLNIESNSYELGLFSSTKNAVILNLALEDLSIEKENVLPDVSNSKVILYVGGLAGKMENTKVENCYVNFKKLDSASANNDIKNYSYLKGQTSFYFGGLAGEMTLGSSIKNCYSNVSIDIMQIGSQNSNIIAGGLCGNFISSNIVNCFSHGDLHCELVPDTTIESNSEINLGGIVGFISGYNSNVLNTYFSGNLIVTNNAQTSATFVGGTIGKMTIISSLTPKEGNINFCYSFPKNNGAISSFGASNNYQFQNLQIYILDQENFALFENENSWSEFEPWDFKYTFSSHLNGFPTLQIFNSYEINLNETNTIIDLGDGIHNDEIPVSLNFLGYQNDQHSFKYGDMVEISIKITDNFKNYYDLSYILISNSIVCTKNEQSEVFFLTKDSELEREYLFSYAINDQTAGEVSVALEKITYNAEIKSDNSLMGKVRNQFSVTSYEKFEQNLANGNVYRFFAVPLSSNFAFSKWVVETLEGEELVTTELDEYFKSSQLSFRFGMNDETPLTELLCKGGKLSAVFSSNICKVKVECKLNSGEVDNNAGKIFVEIDGVKSELKEFSVIKGKEIKLSFETDDGYKFIEWVDENNRRLTADDICFVMAEEDQLNVYARFEKIDDVKNLVWLWITLGVVGGLLLIGVIIWIIVAKRKDKAYKNFY